VTDTRPEHYIRKRYTLSADNYLHSKTNYSVNNKSLSTLTPHYYRYTPLYSRVRLQQNPHYHPPLDRHTRIHTTHPTRPPLSGAARELQTALRHAANEKGNSAPAIVPGRRGQRRCGQFGKSAREMHFFAEPCAADATDFSACPRLSSLPGTHNSGNRMRTACEQRLYNPFYEWPKCSMT
jgi:hypothetical protein